MLTRASTGMVAVGVVIAGVILWRITASSRANWIRNVRWVVAAFAAYGTTGFLQATINGIGLHAALGGYGLFHFLPLILQATFLGAFVVLPLGWIVSVVRAGVPRFREGSLRSGLYQAIALTTCLAMVVTSFSYGSGGVTDSTQMSPQQRAATLNASLQAIEDGDRDLARDTWDPEYVIGMVGRDPQALFEWVKDNTSWIPYRGTLRGPIGVLMDRQGNSLDRALLLANLLEKAGQTVRLAHGELKREQAVAILSSFADHKPPVFDTSGQSIAASPASPIDLRPVSTKYQLDNNSIQRTLVEQQKQIARAQADLTARVSEQTSRLLAAVSKPDRTQELNQRREAAIAALHDHWWVQRQDEQKWIDMDLLSQTDTPSTSSDRTMTAGDLPNDLHHEVAIRVIVEQFSGGARKENTVLEHVFRPSELLGQPVVLQFWPGAWSNNLQSDPNGKYGFKANALEQKQWAVFLKVGRDSVAQAIIGTGDAAGDSGATDSFGAMAGALARSFGQQKTAELTAAWIEYEIRIPGEAPRNIRRAVFDLLGPARRNSGSLPSLPFTAEQRLTRSLSLMMQTEILPMACRIAPEFVMHLAAQSLLKNRELVGSIASEQFSPGSEIAQKQLENVGASGSSLLMLAVLRSEWSRIADHVFLDRPNVLTRHRALVVAGDDLAIQDSVDIVANEVGVALTQEDAFSTRLEQGVLDTNAEALILSGPATDNTGEAYASSHDWLFINPGQNSALSSEFSDDVRRRVSEDLDHGYTVVAPQKPIPKQGGVSADWWRIDPRSGDTLGISSNGWGGAEEASLLQMAFVFIKGFTFEYGLCQGIAQGINGIRILNEKYFGGWHPSWTTGIRSRDPAEIFKENQKVCLIQAIVGGFVATLPLIAITMKARKARMAARLAEEAAAKEAKAAAMEAAWKKYEQELMELPGMNEPVPAKSRVIADADADATKDTMIHRDTIPNDPNADVARNTQVPEARKAVTDPAALQEKQKLIEAGEKKVAQAQQELNKAIRELFDYREGAPNGVLPRADYDFLTEETLQARAELELGEYSAAYDELEEVIAPGLKKSLKPKPQPAPPLPGNGNSTLPEISVGSAGANNALGGGPQ